MLLAGRVERSLEKSRDRGGRRRRGGVNGEERGHGEPVHEVPGGVSQKDSWAQRRAVPALPKARQGGRSRLMDDCQRGGGQRAGDRGPASGFMCYQPHVSSPIEVTCISCR